MTDSDSAEQIQPTSFDAPTASTASGKFKWKCLYSLILIASIGLLVLFAFMFNARALIITSNAENPVIAVTGGVALSLSNGRYLVHKGLYEIEVSASGYHSESQAIQINAESAPSAQVALRPLPGQIHAKFVMEEQVLGVVQIGDTTLGPASQLVIEDLEAGIYQLRADAYLYSPQSVEINVAGREQIERLSFDLEPNWGYLEVDLLPANAEVYAQEYLLQDERGTRRVEAGKTELIIRLEGYKDWRKQVNIHSGEHLNLGKIQLEPVDTQIRISTDPEAAAVTLNGQYRGQTPLTLDLLPDVAHNLQLFKAGYLRQTHEIQVANDSTENLNYRLSANMVGVQLSISPANASIYVDGVLQDQGAQTLRMSSMQHKIEVIAEGYRSETLNFTPVKGTRQLLQVNLLSEEQALLANTPSNYQTVAGNNMLLFAESYSVPMGSSRREPGRRANEAQWTANLERPFYVSTTEITNKQYRLFNPEHSSGHYQNYSLDGANYPATAISWQQAALFCNWLSEKSGLTPFYTTQEGFVAGVNERSTGYRLLTEAEWVLVAKITPAGTAQRYIWGNDEPTVRASENFADQSIADKINYVLANVQDGYPVSAPVASFTPNSKGLYDLGGNVMEWTHDWYQPLPYGATTTVTDPLGPTEGEFHVIRGASWARGYLPQLRLSYRDYGAKGRNDLGFRIARYAM